MSIKGLIQIAGVKNLKEALMLQDCGIRTIGFPLCLSFHKQDISAQKTRDIIGRLDPSVKPVVITYLQNAVEILEICRYTGVNTIQLHADVKQDEISRLKEMQPELEVIKSIIIGISYADSIFKIIDGLSSLVDAFITDTYDPVTGATGATGNTHDWDISRDIVKYTDRPVILAGGLNPLNVREAIIKVRPAGVDSHTGVENDEGEKDINKVKRFISEARAAFSEILES